MVSVPRSLMRSPVIFVEEQSTDAFHHLGVEEPSLGAVEVPVELQRLVRLPTGVHKEALLREGERLTEGLPALGRSDTHHHKEHALRVELRLNLSQLGGVLPAEDSSEVPEERDHDRLVLGPEGHRLGVPVHVEKLDARHRVAADARRGGGRRGGGAKRTNGRRATNRTDARGGEATAPRATLSADDVIARGVLCFYAPRGMEHGATEFRAAGTSSMAHSIQSVCFAEFGLGC